MTHAPFQDFLRTAAPRQRFLYHDGYLFKDRQRGPNFLAVHAIAKAAWALMEEGKVSLVQKYIQPGRALYYIEARPKPHKPVVWEGCYHKDWRGK